MELINAGIAGLGYWGPNLIRNVKESGRARWIWLCDLDENKLQKIGTKNPEAQLTPRFGDILKDDRVQTVFIATPADTHFELVKLTLEAGKHCFVEKPLAMTTEQAVALVNLAEQKKRILMVGHVFEFNDAVLACKELIDSGEIGDLYYLYSHRVNLGVIRQDCNVLWSLAPHDISITNLLMGCPPEKVAATGYRLLGGPFEDVAFIQLYYRGGRVAHLHVSWLDPNKIRRMTLVGSKKMVVYDDVSLDAKITIYDKGVDMVRFEAPNSFSEFQFQLRHGNIIIPKIEFREPLRQEVIHFFDCVQEGSTPKTDGRKGLSVVQVLEAGQRSMERRGEVMHCKGCDL
ncbi:MAG: Gfo/Idh/MocA family oxidoreductase [Deltaproteobacteria bacterium]|nr:Gfo/Idh/MocA family oxidoreductase [Deltaproteobacteria bacterium]MBW2307185.1 Gfo/Idh/MocA family oxidoreductase [Deltaproteobacteria bacterium]